MDKWLLLYLLLDDEYDNDTVVVYKCGWWNENAKFVPEGDSRAYQKGQYKCQIVKNEDLDKIENTKIRDIIYKYFTTARNKKDTYHLSNGWHGEKRFDDFYNAMKAAGFRVVYKQLEEVYG